MRRRGRSAAVGISGAVAAAMVAGGCALPPDLGAPPVFYPVPDGSGPWTIGDVNSDGAIDVLIAAKGNADLLTVLLNDGAGGFSSTTQPWPGQLGAPLLGDVDADEDLDLVSLADTSFDGASVSLGDGAGGFAPPTIVIPGDIPLALFDADADGHPDLLSIDLFSSVGVRRGDGAGGFGPLTALDIHFDGAQSVGVDGGSVVDLDGDGIEDVVLNGTAQMCDDPSCNPRVREWQWLYAGDGIGGFAPRVATNFAGELLGPVQVVAHLGDINEDGHVDVVHSSAWQGDNSLMVSFGNGTPMFADPVQVPTADFMQCSTVVDVVDLDGDGHLDVVGSIKQDQGRILFGDGTGAFPLVRDVRTAGGPSDTTSCSDTKAVDVDLDGRPDLLSFSLSQNRLAVLLNRL